LKYAYFYIAILSIRVLPGLNMKQKQVRLVVLLGAFSIIGIISIQAYFLQKAWNIREKQLIQTISIGLKKVAERMSVVNQTAVPYENPVKQISSNYFVVDVNSVIDANILEYFLSTEFNRLNIQTDYEYAIYDCHTDKMVYGNYINANGGPGPRIPSVNLPKYDKYLYYFGIHFPSVRSTVAGDMTLWFFFTAILFLSVIFFVYAIFVILQQKRLSEMQKDFINNMTHEFKTPISSINISADVIMQPGVVNDPVRIMTYGSIIKQENTRLNQQVEKVLQIARIEKGGFRLKGEEIELNPLIRDIAGPFMAKDPDSLELELRLDKSVGNIIADRLHLTNILYNLLDNAVKYAGEKPEIIVETRKESGQIYLRVSDNGRGIDRKHHKLVFRKFFRVPSGDVHDVKGFGLGLYYVQIICRAHKWRIRLESEPGRGASFIIELPTTKNDRNGS
jgi:two-component system phosphate regulon sensor histidine kinase PhoR